MLMLTGRQWSFWLAGGVKGLPINDAVFKQCLLETAAEDFIVLVDDTQKA